MIIFTLHALERIKQRGISILEIRSIDEEEFSSSVTQQMGTHIYVKNLKTSDLKIIYRIEDDKIIIITCFRIKKENKP